MAVVVARVLGQMVPGLVVVSNEHVTAVQFGGEPQIPVFPEREHVLWGLPE